MIDAISFPFKIFFFYGIAKVSCAGDETGDGDIELSERRYDRDTIL